MYVSERNVKMLSVLENETITRNVVRLSGVLFNMSRRASLIFSLASFNAGV